MRKCTYCSAGSGREFGNLLYKPKTNPDKDHPYKAVIEAFLMIRRPPRSTQKYARRQTLDGKNVRKGYRTERNVGNRIGNMVERTRRSGATFGEGDFKVLGRDVEHKLRVTPRASFTLRWQEYLEGRKKGIAQWAISVEKEGATYTVVIMTLQEYTSLIAAISNYSIHDTNTHSDSLDSSQPNSS